MLSFGAARTLLGLIVGVSYVLDVPAVALAWMIPGGFWIC